MSQGKLSGLVVLVAREGTSRPKASRTTSILGLLACAALALISCAADETDSANDEVGSSEPSALAASGGGVTVDAIATQSWSGGFNGAVRVANNSFPAPISSFEVVFSLAGNASVTGSGWNGTISAPDAAGGRTATSPSYLQFSPLAVGQSWDVGFSANGSFSGSTITGLKVNGQTVPLGGGGPPDTTPPTVSLASSATSVTTAGSLTLTATANDNVGVARVEFRDGSAPLGSVLSGPFTFAVNLSSANNGSHSYAAVAFDAAENSATSAPVNVTVNISGGGTGAGYSTSGGRLFVNGTELVLFGLNWFGMETTDRIVHGTWTGRQIAAFMADFKSKGFNALRLPLSPQSINHGFTIADQPWAGEDFAALSGVDGRTALEYTLGRARDAGLYVLLDFHTCNPSQLGAGLPGGPISCSGYSLQNWLADMATLGSLSLTYPNVVGVDLTNEPHALTWSQWASLASQGGQAVLNVNPNVTIWVEGVGNVSANGGFSANWGGNLFEATALPGIPANRLVFSPHSYGPSVAVLDYFSAPDYPANMPNVWNTLFGHLGGQGFTLIVGEFGGHYTTSSQENMNDRLWQDSFVDYLIARGTTSFFYWAVNPNSGDTGGVYQDDWTTWNQDKLTLLQRLMN
jgi:aryl-phospho-beta-D-glucosidase BglC (GH1 family)